MKRRVVITGMGVVSPLGCDVGLMQNGLCAGKSGIVPLEGFDVSGIHNPTAGAVANFKASDYLGTRGLRALNRTAQLLTVAAKLAIESSGCTTEQLMEAHAGLVSGTMFSSARTISQFDIRGMTEGPSKTSPLDFSNTVINAATGQAAIWHKLAGVNTTVSAGTASSLKALLYAFETIRNGRSKAILAGGVEELCLETYLAFHRAALTSNSSESPCPIPFEASRNGFCLGEGAALLMLEDIASAEARDANILAEIKGGASGFDCQPKATPMNRTRSATSLASTIDAALKDANVAPADIDAVSCAANGDCWYDRAEAQGLSHVFNGKTSSLPVTAVKSMLGESLGASGATQTLSMVASLRDGVLPGIDGLNQLEAGLPIHSASRNTRRINIRSALVNSTGFDGNHCSLVVGRI